MSIFRPQAMRRVELAIPESDVVPVTEALAASGVFHLACGEGASDDGASAAEKWREQAALFTSLERRILTVMEALGVDEGAPPADPGHLIDPEMTQVDVEHLEEEIRAPFRELEEEQQRLGQLQRYVRQLEVVANLDVDLDAMRSLRYSFALAGLMPVANLERLRSSLEHVPSVLIELRREDHLATVVLFGARRDGEILDKAARSAYLNPLNLPDVYHGTPAEAIAALQSNIELARQRIADFQVIIDQLHEARIDHLRYLLWRVRASRALVETIAGYDHLRYTYLVTGWAPASQVPLLKEYVERASDGVLIELETPQRGEETPVALAATPALRPFQGLVTGFGYPCYGEMDPTPVLALTFSLVFGIMFGDVGHGALLVLLGLLLASRVVRALRGLASAGAILIACGASSAILGVLYGSVFGLEEVLFPALWKSPIHNQMDALVAAVAAGGCILSLGMVYNVINAVLARRWGSALFDHNGLAGLALYLSAVGLGIAALEIPLPIPTAILATLVVLSGLGVAFSEPLERLVTGHRPILKDGLFTCLMQAPFELFEVMIGLLSNTLSYVRMGAFAIAHGALSRVLFIMADAVGQPGSVTYLIVLVLGNLFVVGFEGMIVAIQTLRLEYYEFFGRFFSGSGVCFRPLKLVSQE